MRMTSKFQALKHLLRDKKSDAMGRERISINETGAEDGAVPMPSSVISPPQQLTPSLADSDRLDEDNLPLLPPPTAPPRESVMAYIAAFEVYNAAMREDLGIDDSLDQDEADLPLLPAPLSAPPASVNAYIAALEEYDAAMQVTKEART